MSSSIIARQGIIYQYIESIGFKNAIEESGKLVHSIIKFLSLNVDNVICLVIGGGYKCCGSQHVHNVCNIIYCNYVILPIVKSNFDFVTNAKPVLTWDDNFFEVIDNVGVKCLFRPMDKLRSIRNHKIDIQSLHPDIITTNAFSQKRDSTDEDVIQTQKVTRDWVIDRYLFYWEINADISHDTPRGSVVKGAREVLEAFSTGNIPTGMGVIITEPNNLSFQCIEKRVLCSHRFVYLKLTE